MPRGPRSTPAGEHRPVLLSEVLEHLNPQPGGVVVDATVGWGGHAVELLRRVGPTGLVLGMDLDAENLARARERLGAVGNRFVLHHGNFAGLQAALAANEIEGADGLLADLGVSSMQLDAPERGFSYVRDGPLDMRMDPTRGRSAAELLVTISEEELRQALVELADECDAARIAAAIVSVRDHRRLERTGELAQLIVDTLHPGHRGPWRIHPQRHQWKTHPAARTFQALRILVNRELANLRQLLRVLPACVRPGGRAVVIAFHSGEDRLIKTAFREGLRAGTYSRISPEPIRASPVERTTNPRARSAKLRWAVRA